MIYLVTGYMRSGTSLMMQALEAGGLPVIKHPSRRALNERCADARYRPNPLDLYEPAWADMRQVDFPRFHDGHALKIVVPWLGRLAVHVYRVVFMRRDPEEIRQSYEAAFNGHVSVAQIERAVHEALRTLANRRDVLEVHELGYADLVQRPSESLASLHWPIDIPVAAAVVDPSQYRFQRSRLTVGL